MASTSTNIPKARRSPPSPSSPQHLPKKLKREPSPTPPTTSLKPSIPTMPTVDGDLPDPTISQPKVDPVASTSTSNGQGNEQNDQAKGNGKKDSKKQKGKGKHARLMAPDEVLEQDILSALGWDSLSPQKGAPTEEQMYSSKLWPKLSPRKIEENNKAAGAKAESDGEGEEGDEGEEAVEGERPKLWQFTEAEFKVLSLTSHGDGIAVHPPAPEKPKWAVIIPFTLPGDTVWAKVVRHCLYHSYAEPIKITSSDPSTSKFPIQINRDESLIGCKYFGECAGCQYQQIPYSEQLEIKRNVLVKAMKNFSNLPADQIPTVKPTIPSPKQYGYRTKITPHFELPKILRTGKKGRQAVKANGKGKAGQDLVDLEDPAYRTPIGFESKKVPGVMDIEVCPIATETINNALPAARKQVKQQIKSYTRGATLLMRDSLKTTSTKGLAEAPEAEMDEEEAMNAGVVLGKGKKKAGEGLTVDVKVMEPEEHECVTIHSETVTEKVGDKIFQFPAGSFFQNNSSILEPLTSFVRDQIEKDVDEKEEGSYLVDAYCGSGLFGITLANHFTQVCGIEIDSQSIQFAKHNALLNSLSNTSFHAGASESLFQHITDSLAWPGSRTTLILDPPRKGCDASFLEQVGRFNPRRVVYVSCNVHTMARDVGVMVRDSERRGDGDGDGKGGYRIESLGAIDLFPQTHHTEGLCVLVRDV